MTDLTDTYLSRLSFRTRLWVAARLLPSRIAPLSLQQMLAAYEPAPHQRLPAFPLAYVARSVRWAVRSPILMRDRRCLRSGLLGYDVLQRCGYQPRLHFSVDAGSVHSARIAAHCWVSVDGSAVINSPIEGHVPLFDHEAPSRTFAT